MRFSERLGINQPRQILQGRSLDAETRNRLWSAVLDATPIAVGVPFSRSWMAAVYRRVWADFLKEPVDEMPDRQEDVHERIKSIFGASEWYVVFELLEFLMNDANHGKVDRLEESIPRILREENTGFRVVNRRFVEITDEREIAAIEEAIAASLDDFAPVRSHLDASLRLLSDKRNPDYRNSIKESISAVEAAVQVITDDPKAELGKALAKISQAAPIHGAFASALKSLYGFTSDSNGIRHALSEEPRLDAADARFMLAACAAFVMYLRQKA